jgi:hypothetical protein
VGLIVLFVLILIGFFVSVGEKPKLDFDWFKDLLLESNGEKIMSFVIATMAILGLVLYSSYTAYGLALWPIYMIRTALLPSVDAMDPGSGDAPMSSVRASSRRGYNDAGGSIRSGADTNASTRQLRSKYSLVSSANTEALPDSTGSHGSISNTRPFFDFSAMKRNCSMCLFTFSKPFRIIFGSFYLILSILLVLSILMTAQVNYFEIAVKYTHQLIV